VVLSGSNGQIGKELAQGIEAAFADANRRGGVRGRYLRLVTKDDGYDPARATANVQSLVDDDRVMFVLGTFGTGTAAAALEVLRPRGIPLIAPLTGARFLRRPYDPMVVNVRASYDGETHLMVRDAVNSGRTRCSVFYQNDGYGQAGLDGIDVALWNQGFVLHSQGTYDREDGNVTSGVLTMATLSPPQAVFVFATLQPAADFVCMA